MMPVFVVTLSDVIGLSLTALCFVIIGVIYLADWLKRGKKK